MEEPLVDIGNVSDRFEKFLSHENNSKIIFTGKFGIGKSFFLKEFFNHHKEKYSTIMISPVNYVVNQSEDIFELIKVDIIKQLFFQENLKVEERLKIDKFSLIVNYAQKKPLRIAHRFLSAISKLHPILSVTSESIKQINELIEDLRKFEDEWNERLKSEGQKLEDHYNEFEDKPGSYLENNLITQLIKEVLHAIKDQDNKKLVLIIDDLDRVDPEHIFRILNILSAHDVEYRNGNIEFYENKFGFDKTVLVCDINNVQHIFHHRYGKEADFEGYIGKFYSTEYFVFENYDAVEIFINSLDLGLRDTENAFLNYLLNIFVRNKSIELRKLIKYKHYEDINEFDLVNVTFERFFVNANWINTKFFKVSSHDIPFLKVIKLLKLIFGNTEAFLSALNKSLETSLSLNTSERLCFSIVTCIAPLHLIANSMISSDPNFKQRTFVSLGTTDNGYEYIEPPKDNIGEIQFRLNVTWNSFNKYTGTSGYFNDYSIEIISKSNLINSAILIKELERIISLFHKKLLLDKL